MTMLGIRSDYAPAVAEFNDRVFVAWADKYELHTTWWDGMQWRQSQPLGEFTYNAPALCPFHGRLYIALTGTDEYELLNVKSSADGAAFDGKVTFPHDNSPWGPALAEFDDRLFLAWAGVDQQHQLNVTCSRDGVTFPPTEKRILGQASMGAPALASDEAALQSLLLAWTAPDGTLHFGHSADGYAFNFAASLVGADRSSAGPALLTWNWDPDLPALVYIAWTAAVHGPDGAGQLIYMKSTDTRGGGASFGDRTPRPDSSLAGPALAGVNFEQGLPTGPGTYTGYVRGDNHHLNLVLLERI